MSRPRASTMLVHISTSNGTNSKFFDWKHIHRIYILIIFFIKLKVYEWLKVWICSKEYKSKVKGAMFPVLGNENTSFK